MLKKICLLTAFYDKEMSDDQKNYKTNLSKNWYLKKVCKTIISRTTETIVT